MLGPFLAFSGVSAVVIMTPGPDTAVTIGSTLSGGRTGGVCTALGVFCGQVMWTVAASAGISALLVASEPAFLAVKYAGAAYLLFLGLQAGRAALRRAPGEPAAGCAAGPRRSPVSRWRRGLLSDLGNPKMAVFFTSLLPQFGSSFAVLSLLGLVFAAMTFTWLAGYAVAVARLGGVLRRARVRRALDAVTGAALIAFGLRLAAEQR